MVLAWAGKVVRSVRSAMMLTIARSLCMGDNQGLRLLSGMTAMATLVCSCWSGLWGDSQGYALEFGTARVAVLVSCSVLMGCANSPRLLRCALMGCCAAWQIGDEAVDIVSECAKRRKAERLASKNRKQAARLAEERRAQDAKDPAMKCHFVCRRPSIMAAALDGMA
mmetsp:Transcript_151717/g.467683  ORF Transcript_151717/g.467683 Transcript_151717/m.467683 type:complete len:167 (-) Transcript_151717:108-608(-)